MPLLPAVYGRIAHPQLKRKGLLAQTEGHSQFFNILCKYWIKHLMG